ncbi:MAG TPA: tRNA (adenosine(37)-N6)-threonylcarbamoyltransferase complex dimerization subunit type 1 TsaB [Solirubrobacteraceae bacterium]|jgi:tRNA threonylcarbamoyladenosine biosynthesis protein TsaB|nr:tRNA (adenosine(37)-N6)-threonylcarbamoyltransferase complex dimerization subunit type 1 TsaB [Solirubrobacteraceae bacterium]
MIVLGFDTSTPATAVGLRLADGITVQARDDPRDGERPGHATRLLPLAAGLLAQAGLRFADVDRIAVGVGPGTFTGLRIGVASARGLAQSLDAELLGVSSPLALALVAANGEARSQSVLALIDARRGEVFAALYAPVDVPLIEREPLVPRQLASPRALAPADFGEILEAVTANGDDARGWVAVGNGAVLHRDALLALGLRVPAADSALHRVSGEAICALAASGLAQPIDTVLPDYRRRPDAELALEHAIASGGGA